MSVFRHVHVVIVSVLLILLSSMTFLQAQGGTTAIIVIDDFSGKQDAIRQFVRSELDAGLDAQQVIATHGTTILSLINGIDMSSGAPDPSGTNDQCVVAQDGQGVHSMGMRARSMGMGDPFEQLRIQGIYHGHLVQAQTYDAMNNAGINANVITVDIPGFAMDLVAPSINHAVNSALATYDNVIVNMSFAIVPCGVVDDIFAYEEEIVDDPNLAAQHVANIASAIQAASANANTLPGRFIDYLPDVSSIPPGRNLVFIASAGNYSTNFPLYPALFPDVISVSAGEATGSDFEAGSVLDFSNGGEVLMTGVYYYDGNEIRGTTFAAPRLSALMALLMNQAGNYMNTTCYDGISYLPFAQAGVYNNRGLSTMIASNMTPCEGIADLINGMGLVP